MGATAKRRDRPGLVEWGFGAISGCMVSVVLTKKEAD
ncbi:hypothetical protein PSA5_26685, partial [Pseudomonas syringae pv. actinidiae]